MEKELFYDNLAALNDRFGDALFITMKDASAFLGCDYRRLQADRTFPIKRIGRRDMVNKIALARWLA